MNRRGFLKGLAGCLALGAAPAIVRAASLMQVRELRSGLLVPDTQLALASNDLASIDEMLRFFWADHRLTPQTLIVPQSQYAAIQDLLAGPPSRLTAYARIQA